MNNEAYIQDTWQSILTLRERKPLITLFTNMVTANLATNILLALGASPLVTTSIEEGKDVMEQSSAVLLNMGTPDSSWLSIAESLIKQNTQGLPIIFDPVGVGFSTYRNNIAKHILTLSKSYAPLHVIRGNASEIVALAKIAQSIENIGNITQGVDSKIDVEDSLSYAQFLSDTYSCTVMISGMTDYIIHKTTCIKLIGGNSLMPAITGMGCSLTACIAAFSAVTSTSLLAGLAGGILFSAIGAKVGSSITSPGSFSYEFLDAVYSVSLSDLSSFCTVI